MIDRIMEIMLLLFVIMPLGAILGLIFFGPVLFVMGAEMGAIIGGAVIGGILSAMPFIATDLDLWRIQK